MTKLVPRKIQEQIRKKIPVLNMSFPDHYPGEYIKNIARLHKFPCGKKEWDVYYDRKRNSILSDSEMAKKLQGMEKLVMELRSKVADLELENTLLKEELGK